MDALPDPGDGRRRQRMVLAVPRKQKSKAVDQGRAYERSPTMGNDSLEEWPPVDSSKLYDRHVQVVKAYAGRSARTHGWPAPSKSTLDTSHITL